MMAWWDHEELKAPHDRSDRYKVSFPSEYTPEEVKAAQDRINKMTKREKLTTVLLQDGRKIDIYMPLFMDVLPAICDGKSMPEMVLVMMKASTGLTDKEIRELDMVDAAEIMGHLGKAITAFGLLATSK